MNNADESKQKKRKCLYHPAMECPTPNEPCVFTKENSGKKLKRGKPS
ncbi:MAG TPA: hypothetical protein VMT26_05250 [Candidatus Bathyarchaeia archaeon]|nr:hypothetical protein [Candidatus Bathyarchaeia archaeon]